MTHTLNRGSTLLETLIAISIFALIAVGFIASILTLGLSELRSRIRTEAAQAAREATEVAYNLSVQDWDTFKTLSDTYGLEIDEFGYYYLVPGEDNLRATVNMTRNLKLQPMVRSATGNLEATNSSAEPDMMQITSTVTWNMGSQSEEIVYTLYVTNFEL